MKQSEHGIQQKCRSLDSPFLIDTPIPCQNRSQLEQPKDRKIAHQPHSDINAINPWARGETVQTNLPFFPTRVVQDRTRGQCLKGKLGYLHHLPTYRPTDRPNRSQKGKKPFGRPAESNLSVKALDCDPNWETSHFTTGKTIDPFCRFTFFSSSLFLVSQWRALIWILLRNARFRRNKML